ncbi:MAG: glycosyltransferase, partial [Loktanella sp.]|nr:glycosyltransferase [Loktanella sp.]
MKILLITKTLTKGGAASGARNLLGALRAAGADVAALDGYVAQRPQPVRLLRVIERVYERSLHNPETHCLRLGPPVFDLKRLYAQYKPDIIQLCDVSGNTIRFADIGQLTCPVVHRMSDFWPYHGADHYAEQSPHTPKLADRLLRRTIFDGSVLPHCRVAPSHWLASRLGDDNIKVIRNAVSIPEGLALPTLANGVLRFGFIASQIADPRKGFSALAPFLSAVAARSGKTVQLHAYGWAREGSLANIP